MSKRSLTDPSRQLRHFVITCSSDPLTNESFEDPADGAAATDALDLRVQRALTAIDGSIGSNNLRFRIAQLEQGENPDSEQSGVHLHAYVEVFSSVRIRTVWRALPYARVRPRLFRRSTARDYCTPSKGKHLSELLPDGYDPTHLAGPWTVGEWRPDGPDDDVSDSPLDAAVDLVMEGYSMREVAKQFPRVWVRWHRGLRDLSETAGGSSPWTRDGGI